MIRQNIKTISRTDDDDEDDEENVLMLGEKRMSFHSLSVHLKKKRRREPVKKTSKKEN